MNLSSVLPRECVIHSLSANNIEAVLSEIINRISYSGYACDSADVMAQMWKREDTRTMKVRDGIWIPRVGAISVKDMVVGVAKLENAVTLKDTKINFIVLILSPLPKTIEFLKCLMLIAKMVSLPDFRKTIADTTSATDLYDCLISAAERVNWYGE